MYFMQMMKWLLLFCSGVDLATYENNLSAQHILYDMIFFLLVDLVV